ncbi:hypothetical protein JCM6882_004997 [Rhodosporidiobolus microsporus]
MRFHCLGVGSVGSLFATNLASLPSTQVCLILRRKDLAAQLHNPAPKSPTDTPISKTPYGTLTVERDGIARRFSGLEMELTRSPDDAHDLTSVLSSSRTGPQVDPKYWYRNDPIETLVITTKAPSTLPAIRHLLPRLSSRSTVVLCQNGMGVLEGLLAKYWPEDRSLEIEDDEARSGRAKWNATGGRPSFVCATTTHGAWRKGTGHFVHAGVGDVKFGVVPNRAVVRSIADTPQPSWPSPLDNPLINPRSIIQPTLDHIPHTPSTATLHTTISSLLSLHELRPSWLPLPTLQVAQLQKLAVNASVNSLTAVVGVNNGALVGSQKAKRLIEAVCGECSTVFAAHLAREEGAWTPPAQASSAEDDAASPSSSLPPPLPDSHALSAVSLLDYTQRILFKTSTNVSSTLADVLTLQANTTASFDLERNAPSLPSRTEIEYINGYVVALGRRYGIATPTVKALGELVLLKEEMARVGAIDRVWQSRKQAARSPPPSPPPAAAQPPPPPSPTSKHRKSRSASPAASSRSRSPPPPSPPSSPPPSASPPSSPHPRAHERAADFQQYKRERDERAQKKEEERIQRRAEQRKGP